MTKIFKSLFGGPPKPDTSQIDAIKKQNEKTEAKLAAKEKLEGEEKASTLRAIRANRFSGPKTLFSLATGTEDKTKKPGSSDTLGG
jgi:predicted transcriptional regulator